MQDVRQGVKLLCVVMLVACGTSSDATAPRPTITDPSFSKEGETGKRVIEQSVTGHIAIILPAFDNAREHYSLNAVRHRDGSVTGEFNEFSAQMGGQRIRAHVVCFTVTGNSARLAAQIDKTNVDFGPVGSYVVWSVIDNGQGRRSAPDQTTDIFFGGTAAQAQFHCDTGFNLAPFFTGIRGNLRVR